MMNRGLIRASVLAVVLACSGASATYGQSITQALTAAYNYAPDLQSAVLSAKASA